MSAAINGLVLETAHQLYARNSTNPAINTDQKPSSYKVIGLVLAITSGLFIGVSFVFKKLGLLKSNLKYNEEAGEGYGYLKNLWWWGGMTLMILGEICNFAAYLFADAILVTPLGALSVVITAILSSIFLKERLSFVGKIGCFQCIIGAVVIAANAPEQGAVNTIQDMKKLVLTPGFLAYAGVIILGCAAVAIWVAPKYGRKSMLVYITICSLIGGLSVVGIQGLGAAITAQARGISQFKEWFTYVLLVFIVITLVTEIIYLNKALNLYNAALVTPTYYVYFTSSTIVSSAVLFRGFKGTPIQIITVVLGFLMICSGVVLLQLSKSAKDVPDSAVFAGDLDQVRTVAEQEEPEYEPRADSIRGGAALLRAVSQSRHKRETREIQKLKEEHMAPISETEQVEWDGLRRRRTLSSPGSPPQAIQRRKSIHPPLGMSHFPTEEEEHDGDDGMHPGFFNHFRRKNVNSMASNTINVAAVPMSPLKHNSPGSRPTESLSTADSTMTSPHPAQSHVYGLPPSLRRIDNEDTSYHGSAGSQHVQWSNSAPVLPPLSRNDSSFPGPPPPPPHTAGLPPSPRENARRQFSFQNPFNRTHSSRSDDQSIENPSPHRAPLSRSALSFNRKSSAGATRDGATEEERLGLVRGDSVAEGSDPPGYDSHRQSEGSQESDGGERPPGYESGTIVRKSRKRGNSESSEERDSHGQDSTGKDIERGGGGGLQGRAFI